MKSGSFRKSLGFAVLGIRHAIKGESNFRTQMILGGGAILLLVVFRPEPVWWALFFVAIGGVLSAELFNTALEALADGLHPEPHPLIGKAKDCAAGAVLVWSVLSLCLLAAFLSQLKR